MKAWLRDVVDYYIYIHVFILVSYIILKKMRFLAASERKAGVERWLSS